MKTFDEILQRHYIHDKGLNNPKYIKNAAFEFALQVAEAVLNDAEDKIAEYIDPPIDCDDDLFQQGIKRGLLEIKKVNITDFIK